MKKVLLILLKLTILGLVVGLFIAGYQFIGHEVIRLSEFLLTSKNLIWIPTILCSVILLIGLMIANKFHPGYYGGGIPQIEAYHRGWYSFSPYKMLLFMTVNSLFAFFGGFLLGSEGPSVSIGSSLGMIGNDVFKDDNKDDVAIGGSAGFACAFSSPLAGLCHLIEENKHILNLKLILKAVYVIGLAFFISYLVYPHSLLPYIEVDILPAKFYLVLLLLILICVGVSKLYMVLITKVKDFSKRKQFMLYLTPLLLVLFMILRRYYPIFVGSGISTLDPTIVDYSLLFIFGVFLFRLIVTSVNACSNLSGGLVLPTLAIGSLIGILIVKIFCNLIPEIEDFTYIFIVCGMLTTLAVVTNTPITSFVLGLKCAPFKAIALPLLMCLVLGMVPFYLLKWENIYHRLERRLPGYIEH